MIVIFSFLWNNDDNHNDINIDNNDNDNDNDNDNNSNNIWYDDNDVKSDSNDNAKTSMERMTKKGTSLLLPIIIPLIEKGYMDTSAIENLLKVALPHILPRTFIDLASE